MEKYYKILYYLNQNPFENQRALARGVEMSLGQVNGLMRQLTEEGTWKNRRQYPADRKGGIFSGTDDPAESDRPPDL